MNAALPSRRAVVTILGAILLGACSQHTTAPSGPDNGGDVAVIVIRDFSFSTPTLTIDRGQSVRWRTTTGTFHTVTPDGHQAFVSRQLNAAGATFDVRFDAPGRYRYYCEPHRSLGMMGEVIVQ